MAATNDIKRPSRSGASYGFPVLAGQIIYGRTMVGITAAKEAVPAGHVSAVKLVGFAEERIDNSTGATGDQLVKIEKGVFLIALSPTPAVSTINSAVYASDDDTFTLTAGALLQAGTIHCIDADGVWMKTL